MPRGLHAVGAARRGAEWEVAAVPDLRRQAEALVRHLAARVPAPEWSAEPAHRVAPVDGLDRLDQRPGPARYRVAGRGLTLSVFDVGLACCAVEFAPPRCAGHPDLLPLAGDRRDEPGVEVMVVSGTVTDKMAPAVLRHYDAAARAPARHLVRRPAPTPAGRTGTPTA